MTRSGERKGRATRLPRASGKDIPEKATTSPKRKAAILSDRGPVIFR